MPQIFLTSSPFCETELKLTDSNRFSGRFAASVRGMQNALFVPSDPADCRMTEHFADAFRYTMEQSGITFSGYTILDHRNKDRAAALIQSAGLVILAGGHVPTRNAFFAEIGLRDCIRGYDGTVLGISAGSMNAADIVYAQPEEDGEAADPAYQRFLTGLNLTKTMLIPHYQEIKDRMLDGMQLFAEITYPDSFGRQFIALCDGSYLYSDGKTETVCGEAYLIQDGTLRQICKDGEEYVLTG